MKITKYDIKETTTIKKKIQNLDQSYIEAYITNICLAASIQPLFQSYMLLTSLMWIENIGNVTTFTFFLIFYLFAMLGQ